MSGCWKVFFLSLFLIPAVATSGCGPGQVSEEDAVGRDADLDNEDDRGNPGSD